MKHKHIYLSILLVFLVSIDSFSWNSSSYELRPVNSQLNLAITQSEPDLFFETDPLRFNSFPNHPEFLLIKNDPGPFIFLGSYSRFGPGFYSSRLFVYGNEFIDAGNGCPGPLGSYVATKRKMFLLRMGADLFVLMLDWLGDIYISQYTEPNFYCYNGNYDYGYYNYNAPLVCFRPRPVIDPAPQACILPVRGPVGTSSGSSGGGLVLDDNPVLPRKPDPILYGMPETVDAEDREIIYRGNQTKERPKEKRNYNVKPQREYETVAQQNREKSKIKFQKVDYQRRQTGDYTRERAIVEEESSYSTPSRNTRTESRPSQTRTQSRSYTPSRSTNSRSSGSSSYSRPSNNNRSRSSSYSAPKRTTSTPSRSNSVSRPAPKPQQNYSKPAQRPSGSSRPKTNTRTSTPQRKPAAKPSGGSSKGKGRR